MTSISLSALRPPPSLSSARCETRRRARTLVDRLCQGFVPARARGVHAVIEWRVDTGEDVERFQLAIGGGRCTLRRRRSQPNVTIDVGLDDLDALVEGRADPMRLFVSQRLRVWGDMLLAVRLPHFLMA